MTASVDSLHFLHPVHIGQLIMLRSSVNRVFRTSMEVGVKVMTEKLLTGERLHTSSAYLTFVAIDREGKSIADTAGDSRDRRRKTAVPASRRTAGISPGDAQSPAKPSAVSSPCTCT